MRLGRMVVGGLGGGEELAEAVGVEDVVEPAPGLAGGDPEQRRRVAPPAAPAPPARPGRAARRPAPAARAAPRSGRDSAPPARSVSRSGRCGGQRRHRLGQRQADDREDRLARPASDARRRRRRAPSRRGSGAGCRPACRRRRRRRAGANPGSPAGLAAERPQRRGQVVAERRERPRGGRAGAADQHVVPARPAGLGHHRAGGGAQPALGAVARDGVAELLRTGEADANRGRFPGGSRRPGGGGPAASGRGATAAGRARRRGTRGGA